MTRPLGCLESSETYYSLAWSLEPEEVVLKERKWYVQHNYLLLCMIESNRLHVSTLHAGHIQAFTKMSP